MSSSDGYCHEGTCPDPHIHEVIDPLPKASTNPSGILHSRGVRQKRLHTRGIRSGHLVSRAPVRTPTSPRLQVRTPKASRSTYTSVILEVSGPDANCYEGNCPDSIYTSNWSAPLKLVGNRPTPTVTRCPVRTPTYTWFPVRLLSVGTCPDTQQPRGNCSAPLKPGRNSPDTRCPVRTLTYARCPVRILSVSREPVRTPISTR